MDRRKSSSPTGSKEMSGEMRDTLYGTRALASKCVAFCWYHHKWLTVNQLKKHGCLGKQCNALEKRRHIFWDQREQKKAMKKERKKNDH